jgi:hypothetical protein
MTVVSKVVHKSTYKRVVLRRLDHSVVKGFVDGASFLSPEGVRILDREGRAISVPLEGLKAVFFVKKFEGNSQRPERKVFQSRPRMAGLWVRMTFKDSEVLEGILPNNLLEIQSEGFFVTPPDMYSNNLKLFVPRAALQSIGVLGVISGERVRKAPRGDAAQTGEGAGKQIVMFRDPNGDKPKEGL